MHASGLVSQQYLDVCSKHNFNTSNVTRGSELDVPNGYFEQSYECIFEISVKLGHVLWRKVLPQDSPAADANLSSISYDLLVEGRYHIARKLLDFAVYTLKKHSSDQTRRTFIVNLAQAHKWSGDETTSKKIVQSEDWSASDTFKLAEAVLLDNFQNAALVMKKIGNSGELKKNEYREWPLFQKFVKSKEFTDAFVEIFHEPFARVPAAAPTDIAKKIDAALKGNMDIGDEIGTEERDVIERNTPKGLTDEI